MRQLPTAMAAKVMLAADLFARAGLDGTKMDDISAATGVPRATLYYYFTGKEEILTWMFGELLDEVGRAVTRAASSPGSGAQRLALVVEAHLRVFAEHQAASQALQLDLGRAARIPQIASAVDRAFLNPVSHVLADGGADGSLRTTRDPKAAATAILGAITSTGMNAFSAPRRGNVEEVAALLTDLLIEGLRA